MVISKDLIEELGEIDTPTICNSLELVDPALRLAGFSRRPLICPFPTMRPVVGYARTAIIRCSLPPGKRPPSGVPSGSPTMNTSSRGRGQAWP